MAFKIDNIIMQQKAGYEPVQGDAYQRNQQEIARLGQDLLKALGPEIVTSKDVRVDIQEGNRLTLTDNTRSRAMLYNLDPSSQQALGVPSNPEVLHLCERILSAANSCFARMPDVSGRSAASDLPGRATPLPVIPEEDPRADLELQEDNARLNQTIDELQDENQELAAQYTDHVIQLQDEVNALSRANQRLEERHKEICAAVERYRQKNNQTVTDLQEKLAQAAAENAAAKSKIEELHRLLDQNDLTIQQLLQADSSLNEANRELFARNAALDKALEGLGNDYTEVVERWKLASDAMKPILEENRRLRDRNAQLHGALLSLYEHTTRIPPKEPSTPKARVKDDLDARISQKVAALDERMKEMSAALQVAIDERDMAKELALQQHRAIEELTAELEQARAALKATEGRMAQIVDQLDRSNEQDRVAEKARVALLRTPAPDQDDESAVMPESDIFKDAQAFLDEEEAEQGAAAANLEQLEQEKQEALAKIEELEAQLQAARAAATDFKKHHEAVSHTLQLNLQAHEILREELAAAEKLTAQLTQELQRAQAELETRSKTGAEVEDLSRGRDQLLSQISNLTKQNKQLSADLETARKQAREQEARLGPAGAALQELTQSNLALTGRVAAFQANLELAEQFALKQQATIEELQQALRQAERDAQAAQEGFALTLAQTREGFEQQLREAGAAQMLLAQKLQSAETQAARDKAEAARETEAVVAQYNTARAAEQRARQALAALQEASEKALAEAQAKQSATETQRDKIATLATTTIEELRGQIQAFEEADAGKAEQLQTLSSQLEQAQAATTDQAERNEKLRAELAKANETLSGQQVVHAEVLRRKQEELQKALQDNAALQQKVKSNYSTVHKAEQDIATASAIKAENTSLATRVSDLSSQLQSAKAEAQATATALAKLRTDAVAKEEGLNKEIAALKARNGSLVMQVPAAPAKQA